MNTLPALREAVTSLEAREWSPSIELALSLTRAADLAVSNGTPASAVEARNGLVLAEHLFKLRCASMIESNLLVAQRLRTEHELGRMLPDVVREGRPKLSPDRTVLGLSDLGISRNQSADFQRLAQVDRADLEERIAEELNDHELSTAWALRLASLREGAAIVAARPTPPADGFAMDLPRNDYQLVLADPPWQYDSWNGKGTGRVADDHYSTMRLEDICALPVSDICTKDALLLLWVTMPLLREGLQVMAAWGFEYRTAFLVWGKLNKDGTPAVGFGRYTRSNGEMCLLGKRGNGLQPVPGVAVANLLLSQRAKHSAKPARQYDTIHRVFGRDVRRVELFARQRVAGWDVWGLEAPEAITMLDMEEAAG
ncbi:MAG TPA: MT-A70 family methyltransferase [Chloroflexota bacterium]|nr:MT-A70 family methyltransferase [Chloroflexota bacterium]